MTNPHDLKGLVDRIRHSGVMHTSDDWTVELRLGGLRIACADPSPECAKTLGDVVRVWSAVQSGSLVPVERVRELEAENERLKTALKQISYHYDNQDLNHVDYRVKAAGCARHALKGDT